MQTFFLICWTISVPKKKLHSDFDSFWYVGSVLEQCIWLILQMLMTNLSAIPAIHWLQQLIADKCHMSGSAYSNQWNKLVYFLVSYTSICQRQRICGRSQRTMFLSRLWKHFASNWDTTICTCHLGWPSMCKVAYEQCWIASLLKVTCYFSRLEPLKRNLLQRYLLRKVTC